MPTGNTRLLELQKSDDTIFKGSVTPHEAKWSLISYDIQSTPELPQFFFVCLPPEFLLVLGPDHWVVSIGLFWVSFMPLSYNGVCKRPSKKLSFRRAELHLFNSNILFLHILLIHLLNCVLLFFLPLQTWHFLRSK